MSVIMSSWPPTMLRRPPPTRRLRGAGAGPGAGGSGGARLDEDAAGVEAVAGGGGLGVAQEAGVDARVAEAQRLAVDADFAVLQGPYEVVGGVHQRKQVAAVLPAHQVGDGDERLQGA